MADRKALVYHGIPPDHCCCDQTLRILPDGEFICVFMTGGAGEPEKANYVAICRSTDQGATWSKPDVVKRYEDRACLLSEVMVCDSRIVVLMQTHSGHFDDWLNWTIESLDGGHSWSDPIRFDPVPRRAFIRTLYISSWGDWYLPIQSYDNVPDWQVSPLDDGSFKNPVNAVLISSNRGGDWALSGLVEPACNWAENNVVELSDGRLIMLIRADGIGFLRRSESVDRGRTWSPAELTDIKNPGSKFRLHRLSDGRIILIHNSQNTPKGGPAYSVRNCNTARNPLSMWISDDDMQSWPYRRDLTAFPGMLAYPDGQVDAAEEYVHFVFDYNRHDIIYWGASLD